ncbi:putative reverse transcriptase domain-containing protein [Tanacetum coccineum]
MGGPSSQPRTNPPLSSINAFPIGDLYSPQFSDSFQDNTGYWQEPNPHESPVEQVATSPTKKKKATRNRQKRQVQTDDAPRQTAWTTEEEIALAKGWRAISENSERGNTRKKDSFWVEVMEYIESKTKQECRRTYDMVVGKWKVVRPVVVRFCGIYSNVMRMAQESRAEDEDYIQKAMSQISRDSISNFNQGSQGSSKRHKSSGSSSFNAESGDASINLNNTVDDEDDVQEIRRPEGRDNAKNLWSSKGGRSNVVNERLQLRSIEHNKKT